MNTVPKIPVPVNEPVLSHAPGTPERAELKRALKDLSARPIEIPLVIGGKEVRTGKTTDAVMPHCHRHVLAKVHQAGPTEVRGAVAAAREAWRGWSAWTLERRAAGFLQAADPLAGRNLPTSPAIMGNTVVWKPAGTAVFSNYFVLKLLEEAGLPPGVINFVPGAAPQVSEALLADRHLAGIHFTGSTEVFQSLWQGVARNLTSYAGYPRLVGETGGKDFIVAHASADLDALAVAIVRGAYEYQGQKCSAASRAYVPDSLWPKLRERVLGMLGEIRVGDPADFRNFMGAVIDRKAFEKIKSYIEAAKTDAQATLVFGGACDDGDGYFIQPTLIETADPAYRTMCEEIFGPVLSLYVYPEGRWADTLRVVDETSPYALTGAIFAQDRRAVEEAQRALRYAAGNFYVNDKPTGAVVGQQPFGGARASGTNDKAGRIPNLLRLVNPP